MPARSEIPEQYQWNLETVYANEAAWEKDVAAVEALVPTLAGYDGTLGQSAAQLLGALETRDRIGMYLERLFVYAMHRRDEDTTVSKHQGMVDRLTSLAVRISATESYLVPEILALPDGTVDRYLSTEPGLRLYRHHLDDILRARPHVRSAEVEALLAQTYDMSRSFDSIYHMLSDADLQFPTVQNDDGQEVELTHGRYMELIESRNRSVRKAAFTGFYSSFKSHRHTLAGCLAGSVRKDVFFARARNYGSCLEAALDPHNIPVAVYSNLLSAVEKNLPVLHRYLALRKPLLGIDDLHAYDLYTPLVKEVDMKIPYEEAVAMVLRGLAPLGEAYVAELRQGLGSRLADVYENRGKRSGAYSGGGYGTRPFMLLNYQNNLNSALTLAHEAGHSMHSYFSWQTQPFVYSSYTLFVAEVASTVNEALVASELLRTAVDPQVQMYIVNRQAENFRLTLYRQVMFAEFELRMHQRVEEGLPLTVDDLCELYIDVLRKHYGSGVTLDDDIALEWSRIHHFFRPFYVYQYATGISAATALVQQIKSEGQPAVARYMEFLKSGSSDYSINLLRRAGVDMTSTETVQSALNSFAGLVDQMEQLVSQTSGPKA